MLVPQVLQGAIQLSEHLAAHPETSGDHLAGHMQATTVRNTKGQPVAGTHHMGSDMQEPKGENIEQVLRDLEELVDRDLSAKQEKDEKGREQASSSLPEVDQMAEWPSSNSVVTFPSIQLPNISHPSSSSAWLTQTTPPSLGPLSPPRPSLRSTPYKRGGPGVQMGTRGNTEVAWRPCICLFSFIHRWPAGSVVGCLTMQTSSNSIEFSCTVGGGRPRSWFNHRP